MCVCVCVCVCVCSIRPALKTPMDVANLMETLAGLFEGVVQYNRDNKAFEVSGLLNLPGCQGVGQFSVTGLGKV